MVHHFLRPLWALAIAVGLFLLGCQTTTHSLPTPTPPAENPVTTNFRNPHYHQPGDTPETLNSSFLTGSGQRIVDVTVRLLASRTSLKTPD